MNGILLVLFMAGIALGILSIATGPTALAIGLLLCIPALTALIIRWIDSPERGWSQK